MRTFKFRVWDVEESRYVSPYVDNIGLYFYRNWGKPEVEVVPVTWFIEYEQIGNAPRFNVQQFTGIKDKNGKEIYEGDIVKYTEKNDDHGDAQKLIAEVFYQEETGTFMLGKGNNPWNSFSDYGVLFNRDMEVIGNIYEGASESMMDDLTDKLKEAGVYDAGMDN